MMLARTRAVACRRVATRRIGQRFQSTDASFQSSTASHVAAGMAGGVVVLTGGYVWYRSSGLNRLAEAAKTTQTYLDQAQQVVVEKAKNPSEALSYLRNVSKSYLGLVPGLAPYIDSTFDSFDELAEKHGDEVNAIARRGYDEIQAIVKERGKKADLETATKVMGVIQRQSRELQELAKKAGQDVFEPILEKHPEIKEKLGGGYQQLRDLAEKQGPEAQRIYDDTKKQVMEIFSKGFSQDAVSQASSLIQSKTSEVRKLGESSAQDAWKKAMDQARPYLEKLPEVRQQLEDNSGKLVSAAVAFSGGSSTQEIFEKVKSVAEAKGGVQKEKVDELKKFIMSKVDEAEERGSAGMEKGWQALETFIKTVPGGNEMLEKTPDVQVLIKLSQERGEEAKQLAQETYRDLLKVLEDKAQKAKRLAESTK
ncbi:hypothetical protein JAAARDRAFT_207184 [Jaapia argillacea MUCL 33604]|uniref:Uncharacterized protein n=1 Tax=Jaapia argillacea MUCL 33604 TaxID=933084 RepID=A0A067PSI0_9AGAM|nr:hypothetical protein JAAARDRAFT_207184 [Jaapia argillacea MUCL 33604]